MPSDDTPAVYKSYPGKGGQGRAHYRIGPKGIKIIEAMSAKGCHQETIAKVLRISHDTLLACRRRQPEVQAALERGMAVQHDELVEILMKQARQGQFVPAMFLLKTRFGYKEGVQIDANLNVNHSGVLVVPAEMTVEQYLAMKAAEGNLIDVTPQPAPTPQLYPGHAPIEHQPGPAPEPDPEPEPAPQPRTPTGTTIAPFPGPRTRRGD